MAEDSEIEQAPPAGEIGLTEELPEGTEKSLAGITLLETVDGGVIRELESKCTWYFCPKGGHVFDRADTSGDVFFVVTGAIRAADNVESEQEVAFVDMNAGNIIGELSAIDGKERSATLYALEDSVLALVPKDVFLSYMNEYPEVLIRLMMHFVGVIRGLNSRVVGLSSTTVVQRVYEQILEIAEPDPVTPRRLIIEKMPSHKEIAVWAGTTPETVARAVGRLLESEIAIRRFKTLHILDPKRLEELVQAT
jgi:CRP/FNR family transcriptional regulator, cyclic AMP receptor protein